MIGSQLKIIYTNHPLHSSILSNKISIYRKYPNFFLYKKKQIVCTIILTNFIHLEHRFPYRDTRRSIRNNRIVIGWLWCLFKFEWTRSANCFAFLYLTAHFTFILRASSLEPLEQNSPNSTPTKRNSASLLLSRFVPSCKYFFLLRIFSFDATFPPPLLLQILPQTFALPLFIFIFFFHSEFSLAFPHFRRSTSVPNFRSHFRNSCLHGFLDWPDIRKELVMSGTRSRQSRQSARLSFVFWKLLSKHFSW